MEIFCTSQIVTKFDLEAQHEVPTLNYGNACTKLGSPYIGLCNYDGAGAVLQTLYSVTSSGSAVATNLYTFDQTKYFTGKLSLDTTGYIYPNCLQ